MRILLISFCSLDETQDVEKQDAKPTAEATTEEKAPVVSFDPPADVAAPPEDAKKTERSGVQGTPTRYRTRAERDQRGRGSLHWLADRRDHVQQFSQAEQDGRPSEPGHRRLTEGLQLMVAGEKTRFWILEEQTDKGRPGAPSGMLVFDVELVDCALMSERFLTPTTSQMPPDAKRTARTRLQGDSGRNGADHPTESAG